VTKRRCENKKGMKTKTKINKTTILPKKKTTIRGVKRQHLVIQIFGFARRSCSNATAVT